MFKKAFFFILCVLIAIGLDAQVEFQKVSYEEMLKMAKAQSKHIFVDCYTTWCGPCRMLDRDVFSSAKFSQFLNTNHLALKLDMEREGASYADQWSISSYPTMLIISPDGVEVGRIMGYQNVDILIEKINQIHASFHAKLLVDYNRKYQKGERDPQFLASYMLALVAADRSIELPMMDWLDQKKTLNIDDKKLIFQLAHYYNSYATNYIIDNASEYRNLYSSKEFDIKIQDILSHSSQFAAKNNDQTTYEDIIKFIKTKKLNNTQMLIQLVKSQYESKSLIQK